MPKRKVTCDWCNSKNVRKVSEYYHSFWKLTLIRLVCRFCRHEWEIPKEDYDD